MALSFSTICERMRAHAVYLGDGLLFPRVTEAEILACEERLGFNIPPMLRVLYTTVANGSDFFGIDYRFYTISDKFVGYGTGYPVLGELVDDGPRVLDDSTVEALRAHPGAYVTCPRMPAGFVELAQLGCNVCAYLDGFTGHIYIRDDKYVGDDWTGPTFSFGASSLEEWLERKLAVPPSRSSEGRYQPHFPLATVLAADPTQPSGQWDDNAMSLESPFRLGNSEILRYHVHLRAGLERARAEITQQIYELDAVQDNLVERDVNNAARSYETSHIMQHLADVEAQLDKLLETA
jgi:hypothetical protein